MDRKQDLLRVRSFYLLMFGAVGCLFPYLVLYYQRAGLSGRQIGALSAITALVVQLASPLWGLVSDSRALRRWLLTAASGGAGERASSAIRSAPEELPAAVAATSRAASARVFIRDTGC